MSKRVSSFMTGLLVVMLLGGVLQPLEYTRSYAQSDCYLFKETGKSICARFRQYWEQHGGLAQYGYPISDVIGEVSPTDSQLYSVQYFERAVFEFHPENAPPHDVLLSLMGSFLYNQKYARNEPGQTESPDDPSILFPVTGKRVGGLFAKYWQTHGGIAQQGYPISNQLVERNELDGKEYIVQYFERAVFEYHPEQPAPNNVLLSQLGRYRYSRLYTSNVGLAAPYGIPPALSRSSATASLGIQEFAVYLASKYNRLGDVTLTFEVIFGEDTDSHNVFLGLDAASAGLVAARATRGQIDAWTNAVFAEAKRNWSGADFVISLARVIFTPNPCLECKAPCYYVDDSDYIEGRGYWTAHTVSISVHAGGEDVAASCVAGVGQSIRIGVTAAPTATARPPVRTSTRPPAPTARPQPTEPPSTGQRCGAICRDGTSSSATGSGACSRHGGVDHWIYCQVSQP